VCSNYEDIGAQFDKTMAPPVRVYNSGYCQWFPPGRYATPCPIEISWFPFDDQTCMLKFQSWFYSALQLNVTFAYEVVDSSVMNGEWNLIGKLLTF